MKNFVLLLTGLLLSTFTINASEANEHANARYYNYGESFIFSEGGVEFAVYPDGQFDFNINNLRTNVNVSVNTGNVNLNFNSGYDYNAYVSYLSENFKNNKGKTFVHINFSNINSYNFKNIKFKLKNKIIKNMKNLKINFKKNLSNFETEGNYYLSKNKLSDYKINEVFYELNTSKFLIKNYDKFLLN